METLSPPIPTRKGRRSHPQTGCVIDLTWDDDPTEWYVRGHVPLEEAVATVEAHLETEADEAGDEEKPLPRIGEPRHRWARWVLGQDEYGDVCSRRFHLCPGPARGAFAVTEVQDLDDLERWRAIRAERQAHEAVLRARVEEGFPGALVQGLELHVYGGVPGIPYHGHARFRLPGLTYAVEAWEVDPPGTWRVIRADIEAFRRLYKPDVEFEDEGAGAAP